MMVAGAYMSMALEVRFINATSQVWVLVIRLLARQSAPSKDAVTASLIGGLALAFVDTLLIICKGQID